MIDMANRANVAVRLVPLKLRLRHRSLSALAVVSGVDQAICAKAYQR
jgi:hypothetical protein